MSEKEIRSALDKVCTELDLDARCRAARRGIRSAMFPLVLGAGLVAAIGACGDDEEDGTGGATTASNTSSTTSSSSNTAGAGAVGGAMAGAGGVGGSSGGVVGGIGDVYMAPDVPEAVGGARFV